jgi:hypothetical protein
MERLDDVLGQLRWLMGDVLPSLVVTGDEPLDDATRPAG